MAAFAVEAPGELLQAPLAPDLDGERYRGEPPERFRIGLDPMEAAGKFFRDEAGREPSLAPAGVAHQGGEEGLVVLDAVDDRAVEGIGHGVDRSRRGPCHG